MSKTLIKQKYEFNEEDDPISSVHLVKFIKLEIKKLTMIIF